LIQFAQRPTSSHKSTIPKEDFVTIIRRTTGLGILSLSVVGLFLCIAGGIGVWAGKSRLEAVGAAVFGTADEGLDFVGKKLDRVQQALDKSQQRVSGLSRIAERLKNAEADVSKECEPLLHTLDEVFAELRTAESWLDSSHAVASGVSRVSEAVVSSEYAASHQDSAGVAVASKVQEFSEDVADVLAKLQVIRQELVELRDKGKLARQVALRIIARVAVLDQKLAGLSTRIGTLNANVAMTRASCVDLGEKVRRWTTFVVVMFTLILLWFGISQIGMMKHGGRLDRPAGHPGNV